MSSTDDSKHLQFQTDENNLGGNVCSFNVEFTLFRMNLRIKQKSSPDIAPDSTGDRNQEATLGRQMKED